MDPNTIICANANYDNKQSVYKGDSGKAHQEKYKIDI